MHYAVSNSGWMTTKIFEDWFALFTKAVKTRPILLLFDGHMTHLSAKTIVLAENISLVKLPSHCTDILQLLDVSCFNPLKNRHKKSLTEFVHHTGSHDALGKPAFCNLIASIWKKGLTESNIKAGFSTTGIFPVDGTKYKVSRQRVYFLLMEGIKYPDWTKYKVSRLDKVKLDSYNDWITRGSPVDEDGSPKLPLLQNKQECVIVNEANCDDSILYTSVNESVLHSELPRKPQRNNLPFSRVSC